VAASVSVKRLFRQQPSPDLWGSVAAAFGLLLTAWLYAELRAAALRDHHAQVERIAERVAASLQRETELALAFQTSITAKIASEPMTDAVKYRDFVGALRVFELLPSIRTMSVALLVDHASLPQLVAEQNADAARAAMGYPAFAIWPTGDRDIYAPIVLVEPPVGNERVYNFDVYASAERRSAGERALATRQPQASAPVVLAQDTETGRLGTVVMSPIFFNEKAVGFVATGVTIERLLASALRTAAGLNAQVLIEDVGALGSPSDPQIVLALETAPEGQTVERHVEFAGRVWRIRAGLAPQTPTEGGIVWAASLGVLLSLLSGFAAARVLGERRALKRAVFVRTRRLTAANRDLCEQARALARANAAKGEFLSRLGHELRTPLNAVVGFAEMLKLGLGGGALAPRQAQYVRDIHSSGRHLLELINRLLDAMCLEQGKMALGRVAFDVAHEIETAIAMLRPIAAKRNVSIQFTRNDVVNLAIGDPVAFRQVAANLIENAIKFTPREGEICVALSRDSAHVSVAIDDSGIGIPADQLARIFEPFHQVEMGDTRRFEGLGLGLAIVDGLMKEMGGRVSVRSEPGQGSHFRIDLPIAAEAAVASLADGCANPPA
jgi:signal transduction histidine kinase